MGMEDPQRVHSAKNSRRRRWEVKSKESFEASLAVEIDSPQKKETPNTYKGRGDDSFQTNDDEQEEKNFKTYEDTNKAKDYTKQSEKPSSRPKTPSSKLSAAARGTVSKPAKSKPSSAKSKPSSAKSISGSKALKEDHDPDSDLLSAKLGALIDEANVRNKDPQRRSAKDKEKDQTLKEDPPDEIEKTEENLAYNPDPPEYSDVEDKMVVEYSSPEPSAPPMSSFDKGPPRKKRHKKKTESKLLMLNTANEESFISLQLKEMKDDIVDITKSSGLIVAPGLLRASSLPAVNGNINAIFQERIGGFVMTRHGEIDIHKQSERLQDVTQMQTRTSYAVFLQSGFRTFSVLCQGLLAGLTLAHCLMIFLLEADPSKIPSLYNSRMAHIFYALVMFLTTICFTAACDRCDLSGVGVFSGHGLKIPWTPAFYLSSLILSLVAIRAEDVLAHGDIYQETLSQEKIKDLVDWWRWICIARSSTAVLAWLAVVPDPHTDALLDSIQELHKK